MFCRLRQCRQILPKLNLSAILLLFLIKRAALGNLKVNFHCAHLHRFFPLKKGLSKTHQSSLTLKGGSTAFPKPFSPQGTRDVPTALLGAFFFRKPTRPSLPLRKAPHLSPSLSLLRRERMCQPPYSVLKPLRYKVGGPSEVYASSGAAVFCAG